MSEKSKRSGADPDVTIYHNPKCSTSRNTLAAIREAGIEPQVIEYLKHPPGRAKLVDLMKKAGLTPRELVRVKEKLFGELGLDGEKVGDKQIIDAMVEHPILMNRPIVVTAKGVRLCRPMERLQEIL